MGSVNLTKKDTRTSVNLTKGASQADINNAAANAMTYRDDAEGFRDTAETHKNTAQTQAQSATSSANSASASAVSASSSAVTATTKASEASTSASNAATSETNAGQSATDSANSATASAMSATSSATSATAAATSATNASASKNAAEVSATDAAASASQAEILRQATADILDQFGDQYLGSHALDPTTDNDGDALDEGDIYWNSTDNTLRIYTGIVWVAPETIATTAANNAQLAQAAAEVAEANAELSEIASASSESNAAASATAASTSAANASISEANASTSEINAATYMNNALDYATDASLSETNAQTYATNAATSATASASSASSASQIAIGQSTGRANIKPVLNLDFVNQKRLDSKVDFTRPSTATFYDGKKMAKAEENLFRYSDFSSLWYGSSGNTLNSNTVLAPDGTLTASEVIINTNESGVRNNDDIQIGTYTLSLWARSISGGTTYVCVGGSRAAYLRAHREYDSRYRRGDY